MSKFSDIVGAISDFSIGLKQLTGDRALKFLSNNFIASLVWNPTANRTIRLPDTSGTLVTVGYGSYNPVIVLTANKTLVITEQNVCYLCENTTTINITVPDNATVNFPIGTEFEIIQYATSTVTINAGTNVFIYKGGSATTTGHVIIAENYSVSLKYLGSNEWLITGDVR
ncbi:hypothetical protein NIES2100_05330 [Calothrix sp. NIES-2100]|uniref:hypothetical protein n=1 Tax=Calothrix sp. NIES-2100 TaxID=1954172 RepID=UPI000B60D765|nr:hypothetical protein NIES2100_05330 [Calothrix sp. NIES-2100]